MCAACGIATHLVAEPEATATVETPPSSGTISAPPKFAALRNRDCRPYLFGSGLAMMADNVHWSLGLSSAALCVGTALAAGYALSGGRRATS